MKEKFAGPFGVGNFVTGFFVRLNIGVVEKSFAVLDARESITDVRLAGANRFYLAAFEFDADLVALEDVKIAERLAIENRLCGQKCSSSDKRESAICLGR